MNNSRRWGLRTRYLDTDQGREVLLHAAVDCLMEYGVKGTTVQRIAAQASVARRTVYRYFPDRDQLLVEAYFLVPEHRAAPYEGDFPRYFEECVVIAARCREMIGARRKEDRYSDSMAHLIFADDVHKHWMRLLEWPYQRFIRQLRVENPSAAETCRTLNEIAETARLLVAGSRGLDLPEERVRQNVRLLQLFPA